MWTTRCMMLVLLLGMEVRANETVIVPLASDKAVHFLGVDEGQLAIVEDEHDPFFRTLSDLDFELRLAEPLPGVPRRQRLARLQKLYRDAVQPWAPAERDVVANACRSVFESAEPISKAFVPTAWKFVKTDGSEESAAAYTRHDVVILPQQKVAAALRADSARARHRLARLVAHETSHVFSRQHPKVRERCYRRLGFRRVGNIDVGDFLSRRRITNPDGPLVEHVIRVRTPNRGEIDTALVLYSKSDRYSPVDGRRLFDYVRCELFAVERTDNGFRVGGSALRRPVGISPEQATGFFEQVGRNTRYVIHPDEILADNLAILFTRGFAGAMPAGSYDEQLLADLRKSMSGAIDEE